MADAPRSGHFHRVLRPEALGGVPVTDHDVGAGPRDGVADSQVTAVHEESEE